MSGRIALCISIALVAAACQEQPRSASPTPTTSATPQNATAKSAPTCLARYVRDGTRLAKDFAGMTPPAECRELVDDYGQKAHGFGGAGTVQPDPSDDGDRGPNAPRLYALVLRYDQSVSSTPLQTKGFGEDALEGEITDSRPLPNLPATALLDGRAATVHGFYATEVKADLRLVCVIALSLKTESVGTVVCRSTGRRDEDSIEAKAEQIIQEDLPAVRF